MDKNTIWHTVKDLKLILSQYPDDMPVFISGYENGYENFYTPENSRTVKHYPENHNYDGEFQTAENEADTFDALLLDRQLRDD